jgi:hypothetical protein
MDSNFRSKQALFLTLIIGAALTLSCQKKVTTEEESEVDGDAAHYVIETSVTEAGQFATSVEVGELLLSSVKSAEPAQSAAACDLATARSTCDTTNLQTTVTWNNCYLGTAKLKGTITETYSGFGAANCLMTGDGSQVKRAISATDPWVLTLASNATLTRDMDPQTAWDGTTFPNAAEGSTVTRIESGTSNGMTCAANARCFNIVANGLHKTFKGPRGRVWFEHIVDSDLTFTGSRSGGNRVMAGTATVWHELAQHKSVTTFAAVTWGDSTCCYPTSGSVSTVLTGGLTGTMTMAFTNTCGEVTVTNTDASQSTTTLSQCGE